MNIAVLLLSLWAIAATKAGPILKAVPPPVTPPVAAPVPPAPPAVAPVAPAAAPATPPAATPAAKTPPLAAVEVVASKYKVSFKLANVQYAEGLSSYDTALYQAYAGKIEKALMNLYADNNAYREMKMIGFRNETGVIADLTLRFGNDSNNLVSLDALIRTGALGTLPVDPASLQATKDESGPPVAMQMGFGCGQPCGAPQQSTDCCGSTGASPYGMPPMGQFGAPPMPPMPGMPPMMPGMPPMMPGMPPMGGAPFPPMAGGAGQCPGQCPSSCAPSCQQSCCGGAAGPMPPQMG